MSQQPRCLHTRSMNVRRVRSADSRRTRRVLLVGFPPLMLGGLEPALASVSEVLCVPFPGAPFNRAAEEFGPDLVVVDVTYLDEEAARPVITRRLLRSKPTVVYLSDRGAFVDDLREQTTVSLEDSSMAGLVALASGSPLTLVAER
jgi:hypothetical protein